MIKIDMSNKKTIRQLRLINWRKQAPSGVLLVYLLKILERVVIY